MHKRHAFVLGLLAATVMAMGWSHASLGQEHPQARTQGQGLCALHVRLTLEAAGIVLAPTPMAKDMGTALQAAGFFEVEDKPKKGDVVVIQPAPGHPNGHAAVYDGSHWVSDFRQLRGLYPGPAYRASQPDYQIYRYDRESSAET